MSSNEISPILDATSVTVRATTKLIKDFDTTDESNEKLSPEMRANAIQLVSLSTDHQEKVTPTTVNAAVQNPSNQEEQHQNLTPESLALVLKLVTRISQSTSSNNSDTGDISTQNQLLATMNVATAMTIENQSSEIVADPIKLTNE